MIGMALADSAFPLKGQIAFGSKSPIACGSNQCSIVLIQL